MLEPLYTAGEMRAAEGLYPGFPDTAAELMDRAGQALAGHAMLLYPQARRFTVVCGSGANGGDGVIAARALQDADRDVTVVEAAPEDGPKELGDPEVIVDALFGTGFSGEPRPGAARLIEQMNAAGVPILSVDVPSGVDASDGEVEGVAVDAEVTVTFHRPKVGLAVAPGRFHAGRVTVVDIGLEPSDTRHKLVGREILELVPRRGPGDTKYTAGSVLVVGGSPGLTGAPCLAAEAAFRADAGYVAVAVPRSTLAIFEARLLEAVKRPCPEGDEGRLGLAALDTVLEAAERASAVALGPGLGRGGETGELVRRLLAELELPVVLDADGLHGLEPFEREAPTVLTPHSGELARLVGEEPRWVDAHRLEAARRAVERFGCVVVLKGADTIVAAPDEGPLISSLNAPVLATAGTGDVLTGIVGAYLAKGMDARLGAAAAVTAHRVAASLSPAQAGLVASDVVAALPRVFDAL